jgi:hypothetical protein
MRVCEYTRRAHNKFNILFPMELRHNNEAFYAGFIKAFMRGSNRLQRIISKGLRVAVEVENRREKKKKKRKKERQKKAHKNQSTPLLNVAGKSSFNFAPLQPHSLALSLSHRCPFTRSRGALFLLAPRAFFSFALAKKCPSPRHIDSGFLFDLAKEFIKFREGGGASMVRY